MKWSATIEQHDGAFSTSYESDEIYVQSTHDDLISALLFLKRYLMPEADDVRTTRFR